MLVTVPYRYNTRYHCSLGFAQALIEDEALTGLSLLLILYAVENRTQCRAFVTGTVCFLQKSMLCLSSVLRQGEKVSPKDTWKQKKVNLKAVDHIMGCKSGIVQYLYEVFRKLMNLSINAQIWTPCHI